MTTLNCEVVLCSKAASLPREWLPEYGCLPLGEAELLNTLATIEPEWLPRHKVESDDSYRQWIPYVLVQNPLGKLATYRRRGTEQRLHGLWSVGIGGHINPGDLKTPQSLTWRQTWHHALWTGMRRELDEELPGLNDGHSRLLGLIHESLTPVGRVHLGVVFLYRTSSSVLATTSELGEVQWVPLKSLGSPSWPLDRFERWSQLALQLLRIVSEQGSSSGPA